MSKIPVLEIFGPTIQGEGMVIGQKTMFIRTAGCDYSCSWCDSAFTWDGSAKQQVRQMAPEEIWNELVEIGGENFSHVTISGGNPVLLKNIQFLLTLLKENGIRTAIETQGSKWQEWLLQIEEVTISPKPPSSKMKTDFIMLDSIIRKLERKDFSLKVVVFEDYDFEYAVKVHKRYPHVPFFLQVGNDDTKTMDDAALIKNLLQKYERLIEKAVQCKEMNDAKVLPQLHALVWGNKRGV
ncbi:7-cyano-7-deazaguanosine (preQ0) biosynthesis protein QueE [Bacillus cereus BAG1X2-3]|uniref:7-carboxy-7-deazaguanine synthase n=1 Tax=Bacillus cereus TaxID=1396 RepID=A0A2C3LS30_BACCE|nr:7-carboxy-7-deazaguanine synthase QueE [Bacillus cereus]EOO24246.1 7-cyano-7-deazaguanosine (preQ0) biosynthesis protein QueE [Bacillus cereus BAG1X1-1]EOO43406.1 7-cyano-7-deazaguanosine (preQ0) biosynthesis protein QueE [Bacillus cereus BAG1X2-1]EOO44777.1 7-cyano-7-deazaguanosine (preQ0) biosynthesis protein QueE [Bacillus cereus BAG1X2-2]EOO56174.1 7-cyano-7-deazaguanosine (preQ0) biosynthesis protein QueE [Bacillus cereus BAG1X2-3]EOP00738.1 7-cyano-7-deazaguanosine (preQ0) biosynthesi